MASSTDTPTIDQALAAKKAPELPEDTEVRVVGSKFVGVIWHGRSSAHQSGELATRDAAIEWIKKNL
jgi:hypothetical protein